MTAAQPQGYFVAPASGKGPGVLVLHAWWGLNETIKGVCRRLADAGFVVFAPDLYHGKVADNVEDAGIYGKEVDNHFPETMNEVRAASAYLAARSDDPERGIGVVGFSLGTTYALELSNAAPERVRAVVIFYGSWVQDLSHSRAAYLGHFAEDDPYEPRAGAEGLEAELRKLGRPVSFHIYPGTGHWFFEPDVTAPTTLRPPNLPGNGRWVFSRRFCESALADGRA